MLGFTLDRNKKWRRPTWDEGVYLEFTKDFKVRYYGPQKHDQPRVYNSMTIEDLFADDWTEYTEPQPAPELEWRTYDGTSFHLSSKDRAHKAFDLKMTDKGIVQDRPATEVELKSIRASLGIKE